MSLIGLAFFGMIWASSGLVDERGSVFPADFVLANPPFNIDVSSVARARRGRESMRTWRGSASARRWKRCVSTATC